MRRDLVEGLGSLAPARRRALLAALTAEERAALDACWPAWAHDGQEAPAGDWSVWMVMAGRGFGKTRAGAEWVSEFARAHPGAAIALVAATVEEARAVMVDGRSGLIAVAREEERAAMRFERSRKRLVFASGAEAFLYSGASPEGLRGPEHHAAWCDELAKWRHPDAAWANLRLGLRLELGLGERPRTVVTTTPRGVPALTAILERAAAVRTGGATWANPHLADAAVKELVAEHAGTRFGRQELEGVLIGDVEGALFTRATIEAARVEAGTVTSDCPWRRVVVGVDPPASRAGRCGIVVCGLGEDGIGYVLEDASVEGASPEQWAAAVAAAAEAWQADRVVAERNQGGDMVESVLRGAGGGLPVALVHASRGKAARAEPVALRFEKGEAKFAGAFPALEDELAGLIYGGGYDGPGPSPDRADAMVWAMTELLVKRRRAAPRVLRL